MKWLFAKKVVQQSEPPIKITSALTLRERLSLVEERERNEWHKLQKIELLMKQEVDAQRMKWHDTKNGG